MTGGAAVPGRHLGINGHMLFRRLLESNARATLITTIEGYVVSIVTHVVLLGGTILATAEQIAQRDVADSFTPVEFFIPKDRFAGARAIEERIAFMSVTAPGGEGQVVRDSRDATEITVVKEEGRSDDELMGLSAPPAIPEEIPGDSIMTVLDVDTAAARYEDSAAPPYPPTMLEKRIEGSVAIQYVVDTTGTADTTSVVILSSTHADFATSVKKTLPAMRFRPAVMNTHKVRQLVQQLFSFRIDTALVAQQERQPRKP